METEVNSEYQKLISDITYVLLNADLSKTCTEKLNTVKNALSNLGSTPELGGSVKRFYDITTEMAKTYANKNHDYGNSFDRSLNEFGLIASVVRMSDKMNRFKSLANKDAKVKDESMKDTLLDLATYAIMTAMWIEKQ